MTNLRIASLATILSSMMACRAAGTAPGNVHSTPPPEMAHANGGCPMTAPGTSVAVADVPGGVAIQFTTSGEVAKLREHVHHMAEMHDQMAGMHEHNMDHDQPDPGARNGSPGMMIPSTASAVDIDGGAQLVLVPRQTEQLESLRQHAHMHSTQMARAECPMKTMAHP